jgi:hypothetical protein
MSLIRLSYLMSLIRRRRRYHGLQVMQHYHFR